MGRARVVVRSAQREEGLLQPEAEQQNWWAPSSSPSSLGKRTQDGTTKTQEGNKHTYRGKQTDKTERKEEKRRTEWKTAWHTNTHKKSRESKKTGGNWEKPEASCSFSQNRHHGVYHTLSICTSQLSNTIRWQCWSIMRRCVWEQHQVEDKWGKERKQGENSPGSLVTQSTSVPLLIENDSLSLSVRRCAGIRA